MNMLKEFHTNHRRMAYALYAAIFILIVLSAWLVLSRRNDDGLPPADSSSDTGALRVSLLPTAECLPFYVAEAIGVYDSLGLGVVIEDRRAQFDADTALYGHSAHLAATDLVRLHYQTTRGNKAVVLMGLQGVWGVVVAPGLRAGSIKELPDRLMGMSRYSASDLFASQALSNANMDYDDMLRAQANDFGVRANMVVQAQTEVAVLPEPFLAWAGKLKARTLWQVPETEAAVGCLAAQPDVLASKRRSAQVELLLKGYNIAVKHISKKGLQGCDTLVAARYNVPLETLQQMKLPRYKPAALPPATAIERSRSFLSQRGIALSASLLMDDRYIKK